jgi:hypothetical protein
MQRHEYSVDIDATVDEVWEVFWYRAPDRRQHGTSDAGDVRIDILHPGDEHGNGLVRTCWFPVPRWLLSGGVGRSWEWLTEVKPKESWRYDAVGKPLWSRAPGRTRLEDLGGGRTRIHFSEEYEAFNPVMRMLFERRVHEAISRSNDDILAKIEMGVRYHRKRKHREAESGPANL